MREKARYTNVESWREKEIELVDFQAHAHGMLQSTANGVNFVKLA